MGWGIIACLRPVKFGPNRTPAQVPQADRQQAKQQHWRLMGGLNALRGQVDYLDGYLVGRAKVIEMYRQIVNRYGGVTQIYVAQDNWSIHKHDDVLAALTTMSPIEPFGCQLTPRGLIRSKNWGAGCVTMCLKCIGWLVNGPFCVNGLRPFWTNLLMVLKTSSVMSI